jgi:hypothetical protein
MLERCAVLRCRHDYDTWRYSPRMGGLVPSCVPHEMDIIAGAVRLKDGVTVLERGVCAR